MTPTTTVDAPALDWTTEDQQAYERACQPDYPRWLHHVASAGGCTRPVRLHGQIDTIDAATGEILHTARTDAMPDGVIYKACGTRLASQCPTCAETYRRDAYQLIRAGLAGGKGVPDTVTERPCVFLTVTAPSFGQVHSVRSVQTGVDDYGDPIYRYRRCRPRRRRDEHCPHGALLSCPHTHRDDDPAVGKPLCPRCYDYAHAVVWNVYASELWRRTTIAINRYLTRAAGGAKVKASYAKVAEFQARGQVHYHALIRLDPADPDSDAPALLTAANLGDALRHALTTTSFLTAPHPDKPSGWPIRWGEQTDIRIVRHGITGEITDAKVIGYLAKYATKSTEIVGGVTTRITPDNATIYGDPRTHLGRLIAAAWQLGNLPNTPQNTRYRRLRRWAHMLGYGGHFTTKTRRYSITFGALRRARQNWRRRHPTIENEPATEDTTAVPHAHHDADDRTRSTSDRQLALATAARARDHHPHAATITVTQLRYVGHGWRTHGDQLLAATAANRATQQRRTAREEHATTAT